MHTVSFSQALIYSWSSLGIVREQCKTTPCAHSIDTNDISGNDLLDFTCGTDDGKKAEQNDLFHLDTMPFTMYHQLVV